MPLLFNLAAFAVLAAAIWFAGTRLAYLADALAVRFGLGHAIIGLVFLAGLTELPELITTAVAAIQGDAALALNNMFGGITMQTAILACADAVAFGVTLTAFPRKPTTMLECTLLILMLAATLVITVVGDAPLFAHVGVGSIMLAFGYFMAILVLRRYDVEYAWRPVVLDEEKREEERSETRKPRDLTTRALVLQSCAVAAAILICGTLLVEVAQTIALQSGLGSSFIGVTLLAATTSLPELSTTVTAVRMHEYTMAISNIIGSNLIMLLVILPADLLHSEGAILAQAESSARLALVFGILVTAIYLGGLLIKKKPRFLGMGMDSILVLCVYAASIYALYSVR
jgi:cation:H+ antiporter